jgi:hypothetical protein
MHEFELRPLIGPRPLACVLSALLVAGCGSMHGGSSDSDVSSNASGSGVASGTVDRSGTSGASMSNTQSTPVSAGYAPAPATAAPVTAAPSTPAASTVAISKTSAPPAAAPGPVKKSISAWVSCTGTADDTAGVTQAFAAAKNAAFTLVVDCPVRMHSGIDIAKGIFIDNGTTVEFSGAGKFFVDNMFHPAFVIADSSNITLTNWTVEWDGSVPVNSNFGGYELNGKFVPVAGQTQPAGAFNDLILTQWLATNRGVVFNETQGWVKSIWVGGVNPSAVFFITGDTTNLVITGMNIGVPTSAGGNDFLPMAFSLSPNWTANQTVTGKTVHAAPYAAVPHGITFSNIDLDGTLMGWQGNVQDAMFENIRSQRYADLMDANGGNVGGIGKWFPPPHLFYLNYITTGDPSLFNSNIHISNVVDSGPRIGTARDKGGADGNSGYALSLKLGCNDCSVDQYITTRPDGFMDVLPSDGLTVTNVTATWDSTFLNNVYPGWRFPLEGYAHVTFENIQMKDLAAVSIKAPIGNAPYQTNSNIVFNNVQISMNKWGASDLPSPNIVGNNNNVVINFSMAADPSKVTTAQKGAAALSLQATPSSVRVGASALLRWGSRDGSGCVASGAWTGPLAPGGSKTVKLTTAGEKDFTVTCQNTSGASSATVAVVAQ